MHAEIRTPRGKSIIRDLGSPAGTFLNGARIITPVELKAGDQIQIGAYRFRFAESAASRDSGWVKPFALGVGAAAMALGGYYFFWNWTGIEQAADFVESATPVQIALSATPTALATPTVTRSKTPAPTPTASRLQSHSGVHRTAARLRRTPAPKRRAAPKSTPTIAPLATHASVAATIAAVRIAPTIASGWPTPEPVPPPSAAADWFGALNAYRRMARLDPVTVDPKLSAGDLAHAKYLVGNFASEIAKGESLGATMHTEDPARPYYTKPGNDAGHQSDVNEAIEMPGQRLLPSWAIDWWMSAPFHRASILNPALTRVGYGEFCARQVCVAALNATAGIDVPAPAGTLYDQPIEFPPPASTTDLLTLFGEWPNPISGCARYSPPSGIPISVQIGANVDAKLGDYSLVVTSGDSAGTAEEVCGFDAATYRNPNALDQAWARSILHGFGEVVMVPKNPLLRGVSYRATLTINGKTYTWPFSTAP